MTSLFLFAGTIWKYWNPFNISHTLVILKMASRKSCGAVWELMKTVEINKQKADVENILKTRSNIERNNEVNKSVAMFFSPFSRVYFGFFFSPFLSLSSQLFFFFLTSINILTSTVFPQIDWLHCLNLATLMSSYFPRN